MDLKGYGFTYKGIHSDAYQVVANKTTQSMFPPLLKSTIKAPGHPGLYYDRTELGPRWIKVDITIQADSLSDFRPLIRSIAAWLDPSDGPQPLIFDNEPDKTYYAVLDEGMGGGTGTQATNINQIVLLGKGTITFLCPDPFAYGAQKSQTINDPTGGPVNTTINNEGTASVYPTITATVQKDITFLDIINKDQYMRVGEPYSVEQQPFQKEVLVLDDNCSSMTNWGTSGSAVDDGTVTGTMTSDGNDMYASDYGTGATWHGPAVKHSLATPLQDFRVEAYLRNLNISSPDEIGRAGVYLLDNANNELFKMDIRDSWSHSENIFAEVRLGDQASNEYMIDTDGQYKGWWNNFQGVIKLQRIGQTFWAYVAMITTDGTNKHFREWHTGYQDDVSAYQTQLSQIQLHLGQYGTYTPTDQAFQRIRIYQINTPGSTQIPYIASAGDVLEFDHAHSAIRKNGQIINDLKDLGADFFPLQIGSSSLIVNPSDAAIVTVDFQERWL